MDAKRNLDQETWRELRHAIHVASRQIVAAGSYEYSNELIVLMECWRVFHHKSAPWVCIRSNCRSWFRPPRIPSYSQFQRRIAGEECQAILQRVHELLVGVDRPVVQGYLDGKPLLVNSVSKDPDARSGHITGGFGKGYKLHAYIDERRRILCWSVMPLNVGEMPVALEMIRNHLPPQAPGALNLGDGNYDSSDLYKGFEQAGSALLTPLRNQHQRTDGQHHPVTLRQMGPARRAAVAVWDQHPDLAQYLLKDRNRAEGVFSVLTMAVNLHLPGWVRRLPRVRRWVGIKLLIYHARLNAQERLSRTN